MPTQSSKSTISSATATACFSFSFSAFSLTICGNVLSSPSTRYHQTSMAQAPHPPAASDAKPPIYLLDSMAFIFRAYHAMQRHRPISTRTGIPTAATYVFVNMINKLRKDFQPEYLAAVYDVGAPVHRNELATQLKDVRKFNIKTQAFEPVDY